MPRCVACITVPLLMPHNGMLPGAFAVDHSIGRHIFRIAAWLRCADRTAARAASPAPLLRPPRRDRINGRYALAILPDARAGSNVTGGCLLYNAVCSPYCAFFRRSCLRAFVTLCGILCFRVHACRMRNGQRLRRGTPVTFHYYPAAVSAGPHLALRSAFRGSTRVFRTLPSVNTTLAPVHILCRFGLTFSVGDCYNTYSFVSADLLRGATHRWRFCCACYACYATGFTHPPSHCICAYLVAPAASAYVFLLRCRCCLISGARGAHLHRPSVAGRRISLPGRRTGLAWTAPHSFGTCDVLHHCRCAPARRKTVLPSVLGWTLRVPAMPLAGRPSPLSFNLLFSTTCSAVCYLIHI